MEMQGSMWNRNVREEIDRIIGLFPQVEEIELETEENVIEAGFNNLEDFRIISRLNDICNRFLDLLFDETNFPDEEERNKRIRNIEHDIVKIHVLNRGVRNDKTN